MSHPTCLQLRTQLKEIKELKAEFDLELLKIQDTSDTALALSLEEDIRNRVEETQDILYKESRYYQMLIAEHIMQKDFLGPEAIETSFGFKPETKDIPPMLFSRAELERAKELGQFLVLRIDKIPDGHPLTMKAMNELKEGKAKDGGNILYKLDRYKDEQFYAADTPSLGWALISKEVIPNSTGKKYLEQTEEIAKYLETRVFKDRVMPEEYQEAINEFKQVKDGIKIISGTNYTWELAAQKLEQLKINQLFRQTPSEVLYDILLKKEKTGEYLLSHIYTWTSRRASDGRLVFVGNFGVDGAIVNRDTPGNYNGYLGVAFSRRL